MEKLFIRAKRNRKDDVRAFRDSGIYQKYIPTMASNFQREIEKVKLDFEEE